MPFQSKKQQKFMFSQLPEIAEKWKNMMSKKGFANLPEKKNPKTPPAQEPQRKKKSPSKKNGTSR